ncbi:MULTISPECIES: 4-hydroxybenzoate 3-monooxygenase [unclassified Meiothermus]|uniref:4-hydroxybenzoate 3-monooxygenase n=1 Tax=unclassified Meiothermus TaxID=370471 RepID=UPI000D7CF781|nr:MULTISPECIES: 4-hydroxybenzoate 3-monooxygenase [unclassified Meiothermus]PZA07669.1 4-hydroxybenzoate 3-monooxygenase [Meiothermus sp. Pnk-1]RYM36506.1 4-hydroxybenzoate 3-monooxygenase [Meiothermus sp. PNK-Is4]
MVKVGIVGAGPAGLLLAHLLHREGIEAVVLEARSREYLETSPHRIRAGVLEWGSREILRRAGLGERMLEQGLEHRGVYLAFDGALHHLDFPSLTEGKSIWVYGQQFVVQDMIRLYLAQGGEIRFEHEVLGLEAAPEGLRLLYRTPEGATEQLACEFVVGADGSHSRLRAQIPGARLYQKNYPFAWLGILAEALPAAEELIYASHPRGFALFSMRSPTRSRNYLQVGVEERLEDWPEERIWAELSERLAGVAEVRPGPLLEKSLTPLRSLVVEPMQHGRFFLMGDAAHVVPPTGAKGMNLALSDAVLLYRALLAYYRRGEEGFLLGYTQDALRHVWQAELFSYFMTTLLHTPADPFDDGLRTAQLRHLAESPHLRRFLAENYVGLYTSGRYAGWVGGEVPA